MTLSKLTYKELKRRPGRTILSLLGIAIGVASVVAVAFSIQAARKAYHDFYSSVAGDASLEVVAEGFGGFDPILAA